MNGRTIRRPKHLCVDRSPFVLRCPSAPWDNYVAMVDENSKPDPEVDDPILALVGAGKHLWADKDPDEYVRALREGWE
jgi:hypothetical protein